jgi:hypothetical protein
VGFDVQPRSLDRVGFTVSKFGTNFAEMHFMPKSSVKMDCT